MNAAPEVSVVVPTRNRAWRLAALLERLAAQRGPRFEVIVVDDASTDETPTVLADPPEGLALRAVRQDRGGGPAAARNAGWRVARAPLVAFVDDDCLVEPGWLAALAARQEGRPDAFVQGRTEPDPRELHRHGAFSRSNLVDAVNRDYASCNIAYPQALLERLGGFDDSYRFAAAEDTDLAWRAIELGATPLFAEDARVLHAVHSLGVLRLVRGVRKKADVARLVKRHPGLRAHCGLRVFWKPDHQWLALAAAGVMLRHRTRGGSLALATPYVAFHRRQHGSLAGTLAALPGHVAVDAAEIAVLLAGSVRFGTLII